jgi:GTPase SAR1 family protein
MAIKLIIVGTSGVGKTSLVEYFIHEQFSTDVVSSVSPACANATITLADQTQVDQPSGCEKRDLNTFVNFGIEVLSGRVRWFITIRYRSGNHQHVT